MSGWRGLQEGSGKDKDTTIIHLGPGHLRFAQICPSHRLFKSLSLALDLHPPTHTLE